MPLSTTKNSGRTGFTLVELAIVLVIIGLLIGGVMGGLNMIKQSEVQTIVSDYSKYSGAVANFRQKYGGLPGDLIDATNYWGDDATATVGCADAAVVNGTPGTCNGNSDGNMSTIAIAASPAPAYEEPYRAWQHLVLAQLIKGKYTGRGGNTTAGTGTAATPGTNVPRSSVNGAGWSFGYKAATGALAIPPAAADANQFDQELSNFLALGKAATSNPLTQGAAFPPADAAQIDQKMDDGKPGTGRIVTMKTTVLANCATSNTDASATYNVSNKTDACSLNMSLTLK